MKHVFTLFTSLLLLLVSGAHAQQWTWLTGGNTPNVLPNYVDDPGGRQKCSMWAGHDGILYLFGGDNFDSNFIFGDLWSFDTLTTQWTWIAGSSSPNSPGIYGVIGESQQGNQPGSRKDAASWVDSQGNLWLFGGVGYGVTSELGRLNDLWKYDPVVGLWTWISGSNQVNIYGNYGETGVPSNTNMPGTRGESAHWISNDELYLFGGNGQGDVSNGYLKDLWKYSISENQWVHLGGGGIADVAPNYGELNASSSTNHPGTRVGSCNWISSDGTKLYLFGGAGGAWGGVLNDLWQYDLSTNNWTWIGGTSTTGDLGSTGELGVPSINNRPAGRLQAVSFAQNNYLWLFGGYTNYYINDLWRYNITTGEWTWMGGEVNGGDLGAYLEQGPSSLPNYPSNKEGAQGCVSDNGKFWLFGGTGSVGGVMNDLWKLEVAPDAPALTCIPLPANLQNGLVGYWPFCGNANDESGNGNDGVVNGATLTEDRFGNEGSAYHLSSIGSRIDLFSGFSNFTETRTIAFWFKNEHTANVEYLLSYRPTCMGFDESYFEFYTENGQIGYAHNGGVMSVVPYTQNAWISVILILENGSANLYLDGILVASMLGGEYQPMTQYAVFGVSSSSACITNFSLNETRLIGDIDDIGIWNRALTPAEITSLYTGEPVVQPACAELDPSLQNGLVGYWPFCGNANDESGNVNDGVVNGATLTEDRFGNVESAYQFNGNAEHIAMPPGSSSDLNLIEDLTVSVWINCEILAGDGYPLLSFNDGVEGLGGYGFGLGDFETTNMRFFSNGWYYFTSPFPENSEWHNFVAVLNSGTLSLYQDGSLDTSYTNVPYPQSWNGLRTLGVANNVSGLQLNGLYLNGSLDDIGIWNRALTPAEITSLYTGEPVVQPACAELDPALQNGLVGYWPFCGNANDESGNENNGVVNGATLTEDRFGNVDQSYQFSLSDITVPIPNSQFAGDFTLSTWVRIDSYSELSNNYPTFIWEENAGLVMQGEAYNGQVGFNCYFLDNYNIGGSQVEDGHVQANANLSQWNHVVLANQNGINSLYVNGVLTAVSEFESTLQGVQAGTFLKFGDGGEFASEDFFGALDDIGIWNRALTAEEVALLYGNFTQTIPGCTDPLAFNYNPQANQNEGCLYTASVFVYNDLNGNGEHESNEPGLANWPVVGNDINGLLWTNGNGNAFVAVPQGAYQFTVLNTTDNWVLTTEASGILSMGSNNCTDQAGNPVPCPNPTLSFGLQVIPGEAIVAAGPFTGFWDILHCTDGYESGVYLENIGSQTVSGFMTLTCDPLFTPNASSYFTTPPAETGPGYALWNIEDFLPGEYELLSYFVPGPGVEYLNAVFNFSLELTLLDPQGNIIYDETWDASPIVACAYDPNDLTGYPEGLDSPHDEGYTIEHFMRPDNMVEFRVRFQNTGTLPAEDIDIYIPIDASVWDLSTIEPLARAADMQVLCLHDGGDIDFSLYDSLEHELPEGVSASDLLIFSFEDIFLPDSASDPNGSQGYVFFQMQAKHGLDVNTELNAQAFIYFEQNPPITTNETYHVIFDCESFTPMVGDTIYCDEETMVFDATQPYVDSYTWTLNNGLIGNQSTVSHPAETGNYELELTTENVLCSATNPTIQGVLHQVTVLVNNRPTLYQNTSDEYCEGADIDFNAQSNGTVYWSNGIENGSTISADQSFTVDVFALNEANCSSDTLTWDVTVNPLPSAAVDSANFVLTAADGVAWQWSVNGAVDATTQSITATVNGNYQVEITNEFGCIAISDVIEVELPIPDNVFVHSWSTLHLYPNPMKDLARLELPQGTFDVALFDISGACVRTMPQQQGTVVIERESLASGVYQLQVSQGEVMKSVRLVVE